MLQTTYRGQEEDTLHELLPLVSAMEEGTEEYKLLAEKYKDEGNAAFQLGTAEGVKRSIELYTQAIELDPGKFACP